ncbi:MAG: D-alanyl-D-alanine dipeptidase [Bacteroidia bacterium]|nr:D-alanyl-D-alanine dipeptidase [Bacteroidia bacterium]
MKLWLSLIFLVVIPVGCKNTSSEIYGKEESSSPAIEVKQLVADYDTSEWTELIQLDSSIILDIKYATEDNFVGEKMYDCGRCFLRPEAARAVKRAQEILRQKNYSLLMFDCYRPKPFQQRLWDKVPDPRYVTPPEKGSMHNRGLAVDLTLVDAEGHMVDMGTAYDYFGERAYQTFTDLPDQVLKHRKLLNETMDQVGFKPIRTEWWHFSLRGLDYEIADMVWPCP